MNENNQGQSHSSMNSAAEPRTPPAEIIPAQKRRGPRTATGKRISSENARTHGLLSKVTVLKNESQSDFNSLLKGLRKDRRPVGTLEEILVDKLASDLWRRRRGIIVEGAEIEKGAAFLEWDEKERQRMEAGENFHKKLFDLENEDENCTLIQRIANPRILQRCLDLLGELREQIQRNGLDEDADEEILIEIYGSSEHWVQTLFDSYNVWQLTASCSDEERQQNGYASVQQCIQNFLEELDGEIMRLNHYS
jgi:hypothetical protein